jgi:quercetin dioxygenase-like cupin family protein
MHVPRSRRFLVLLAVLLTAGAVASIAAAAVIGRQVFVEGTNLQYRFERVVTDASGFHSGWHTHPGLVIVQIEAGSVQFTQGSCTARTFGPGETIFEVPWKPARFVATGSAAWTTSFFVPISQQLSVPLRAYSPEQPSPCP